MGRNRDLVINLAGIAPCVGRIRILNIDRSPPPCVDQFSNHDLRDRCFVLVAIAVINEREAEKKSNVVLSERDFAGLEMKSI